MYSPTVEIKLSDLTPDRIAGMDSVFKRNGLIIPVEYGYVKRIPFPDLYIYCHLNGIYNIVTYELIDYLKKRLMGRSVIEVGTGNGTLGRALHIPITDSRQQEEKEVKEWLKSIKHHPIQYADDVQKLDALSAVKMWKPDIVLGSWITHKHSPLLQSAGGNMNGVEYAEIMNYVKHFIHIGNKSVHKLNPIFKNKSFKVKEFKLPFLISKSKARGQNRLWIISNKK